MTIKKHYSIGVHYLSGGLNHLFRRIIFSIHGHGKWFLKNCISFLWSGEIIVIGYNLVSFLHIFMENIDLISIWFFLIAWQWIWFKNYLLNPENHQVNLWKSAKCCYFHNRFQYSYSFQYQSKIIRVIQIKIKKYKPFCL